MKMSNTKTKKRSKRQEPPDMHPGDSVQYRPTSAFDKTMDLDDLDLDMFSRVQRDSLVTESAQSFSSDDQMSMTGWKVKSQKRTWVTKSIVDEVDPLEYVDFLVGGCFCCVSHVADCFPSRGWWLYMCI